VAGRPEHVPIGPESASSGRTHERETAIQAAADKLGRLLFQASIQLTVSGPSAHAPQAQAKLKQMVSAFGLFHAPGLASFRTWQPGWLRQRQPPRFLLSADELATLWHPPTATVRSPTLAAVDSRELDPPALLPTRTRHGNIAILGKVAFRTQHEPFGILDDDRRRYQVQGTGLFKHQHDRQWSLDPAAKKCVRTALTTCRLVSRNRCA
jgi:hypothetical protein